MIRYLNAENRWLGAVLQQLAVGPNGDLQLSAGAMSGIFLVGPLTGPSPMARWQRLRADVDLPESCHVRFATLVTNDATPRQLGEIAALFGSTGRVLANTRPPIPTALGQWNGAAPDLLDVPLSHHAGLFLWVGGMIERTGPSRPSLRQMRLDGDRAPWTEALPAIYRAADPNAVALERIVSPFQDALEDEEARLNSLASSIDPWSAPDDGRPGSPLEWLAGWLAMALDEQWPESQRRRVLASAFVEYSRRGTSNGLKWLIKCHVDVDVTIVDGAAAPPGYDFIVQVPQVSLNKAGVQDRVQKVVERFKPVLTRFQVIAGP